MLTRIFLVLATLLLAACTASPNRVTFVTATSAGIDSDPITGSVAIGYNRAEGYAAPVTGGEAPPVLGAVNGSLDIMKPRVRQLFATGDAAILAAGGEVPRLPSRTQSGSRRVMFFGTASTLGLKASLSSTGYPAMQLGYKRQEMASIPLAADGDGRLASVVAALDLDGNATNSPGITIRQFVATGAAAETRAASPGLRAAFDAMAEEAVNAQ